ncbi:hypothetical protein GGX14DRAFT_369538, partial [Mycena pura]
LIATMQPFREATLRVSTNKHPRIFEVIPIIDLLTKFLEDAVREDRSTRPHFDVVRAAALAGLGLLDKYYEKTDESIMYRVGMLMHPSYRLSYFEKQDWPQEWKDQALNLARAQWTLNYKVQAPRMATSQVRLSIAQTPARYSSNSAENQIERTFRRSR